MTLPTSGELSLLALQGEFGGSTPITITEYYRNGGLVDASTIAGDGSFITNPTTGVVLQAPATITDDPVGPMAPNPQVQLSQFYGTRAVIVGNTGLITAPVESYSLSDFVDVPLPAGVDLIRFFLVGGGGGSTISGTVNTSWAGAVNVARTLRFFIGRGGQRGLSGVNSNSSVYPAARGGHGYPMNGVTWTGGTWNTWMNTYAVAWDQIGALYGSNPGSWSYRTLQFPNAGSYTFQFVADDHLQIWIDGSLFANTSGMNDQAYNAGSSYNLASPLTKSVSLSAGVHKISFFFTNLGSQGGYGVRIVNNTTASQMWTTRDEYDGWRSYPVGGNGGYPGDGAHPSSMGGAGGSATMLSIIHPSYGEYPIAIAGGGGGGGGGAGIDRQPVRKDANFATQGWTVAAGYPNRAAGGEGEYCDRPNNGSRGYAVVQGGGGGGGGGGVSNDRVYVPVANRQWIISGLGGRTFRGNVFSDDSAADGGESGKSAVSAYATRYADVMHVPTTSRFPILPLNPSGISGALLSQLNFGGAGGIGSFTYNTTNGTAGTDGVAYVDWGLTTTSVTAPLVSRSTLRCSIICYEATPAPLNTASVYTPGNYIVESGTPLSFTLDAFGGGGNPGSEYSYSWANISGGASISGSTSYRATITPPDVPNTSGTVQCTVSDGAFVAQANFNWHVAEAYVNVPITCFVAGSRVMMANGTEQQIENIRVGDMVMGPDGPVEILTMETPSLGERKLLRFEDGHTWSEEHTHWTKQDSDETEWWWSANPASWLAEVQADAIGGLLDNSTMRTGDGHKFAHLDGWKTNTITEVSAPESTRLYLPTTSGAPIIVDGYLVGAGINEAGYDYTTIDWGAIRPDLALLHSRANHIGAPEVQQPPEPALPDPEPPLAEYGFPIAPVVGP